MPDEVKCEKCGEVLRDKALACWACGALTPAGRQAREAKGAGDEEEEVWRRSVAAAKARHSQAPPVDPEEALRRAVAASGTEEQLQRLTKMEIAHDDHRTEYSALRGSARNIFMVGMLLAVLFCLTGLVLLIAAIGETSTSFAGVMAGIGLAVFMGAIGLTVYFLFKYYADTVALLADLGDNSRRLVLLLRSLVAKEPAQSEKPSG